MQQTEKDDQGGNKGCHREGLKEKQTCSERNGGARRGMYRKSWALVTIPAAGTYQKVNYCRYNDKLQQKGKTAIRVTWGGGDSRGLQWEVPRKTHEYCRKGPFLAGGAIRGIEKTEKGAGVSHAPKDAFITAGQRPEERECVLLLGLKVKRGTTVT